ncbi:hypothetical protein H5410_061487 [Solanum commersonii]|uniref:Uncharacterized protein n=1 Tax=Solanum commersonii TaxID=4109 RepID=A0A9J5W866_SOLCO|nr:hypothetical protein H5410_061487 [Solanum commersonii]
MKNLQHPLPISWNWKFSTLQKLMSKNVLRRITRPVSRDHQCTRRSALWSTSSPFSSCLQHLPVLDHWGSATGTLGEVKAIRRLAECIRQSSGHLFFVFSAFKKDVSSNATQDSIMNEHTRLNLLKRRSNVHLKFQVVTHHYQRISNSLYLLQMQVQAQQRKSNALTQRMISYSHTMV